MPGDPWMLFGVTRGVRRREGGPGRTDSDPGGARSRAGVHDRRVLGEMIYAKRRGSPTGTGVGQAGPGGGQV